VDAEAEEKKESGHAANCAMKTSTAFYVLPFVEITPSCLHRAVVSSWTPRLQGLTSHVNNAAMMCLVPP
jgi:hypothetical protein